MDSPDPWGGRLSAADVQDVLFVRAGLGRRGYDEAEVDGFLERVQQELTRLDAEKAELQDRIARLERQLSVGTPVTAAHEVLSKAEASRQAIRLLAAAQQTADLYVADAEQQSRRLAVDAREHADQMVEEARRAARRLVAEADRVVQGTVSRGTDLGRTATTGAELDRQTAYVESVGHAVRIQLRTYLEALLRDVEDQWMQADPRASARREVPLPASSGRPAAGVSTEPASDSPAGVPAALPPEQDLVGDGSPRDGDAADEPRADGPRADGSSADGSSVDGSSVDGSGAHRSGAGGSPADGRSDHGEATDGPADERPTADGSPVHDPPEGGPPGGDQDARPGAGPRGAPKSGRTRKRTTITLHTH